MFSDYSKRINLRRSGALLLLQNSGEGEFSQTDKQLLEAIARQYSQNLRWNDLRLISEVIIYDRKEVVEAFIHKIAQAEYVVTDCLQGMLLCAITQTPCILLSKGNSIVAAVYEWVSEQEYILLLEELGGFEEAVQNMIRIDTAVYNKKGIHEAFAELTMHFQKIMR